MIDFLIRIWMYLLTAAAGIVGFYLATNWKRVSVQKKITGFFMIALSFHMLEERVYPAGYSYIFNIAMSSNMNKLGVMVCNVLFVVLVLIAFCKLSDKPWAVLTIAMMGVVEFAIHIGLGISSLDMFAEAGQVIPYSPGLFTSVFFFLPISIWAFVYLIKRKALSLSNMKSTLKTVGFGLLGMVVIGLGVILMPQVVFDDPDGTYAYTDQGYYNQYIIEESQGGILND